MAERQAATERQVDLVPLAFRADIGSSDVDARTVDLVFSTGAPVTRFDWMSGKSYIETLSMKPGHVRLDRLNRGAPFLDAHSTFGIGSQLGVVVDDSAEVRGGKATATVRMSKRADVEPIFQDIRDRIIRNVSVGYLVHKYEEFGGGADGAPLHRHAIDWEPYEISAVPMPADAGAQIRAADNKSQTNPCVIVTRAEEKPMDEDRAETIVADNPLLQPVDDARQQETPEVDERAEGAAAEHERCQGIRIACLAARLPRSFEDKLIGDRSLSLVKAQGQVFEELRRRGGDDQGPRKGPSGASEVLVGDDPLVHVRAGIEGALLHRIAPNNFKLDEKSRPYRGMSLLDVGRAFLNSRGERTSHLDRSKLVDRLLARAGWHTTTDFPSLFEDVANKNLRAAYEAAPQTWRTISRLVTLSDFRPSRQLQVGDAPALLEVLEHGEYTYGTIGEAKETIQLKTYGRMFGITRQALINDNLNAFGEVPSAFGRKARDIESDLAWAQITSNPVMGDAVALFHATHGNLTGTGTAISIASLGIGRGMLRVQKGIDGVSTLNLTPRYLVVPASLETVADQFVTQITPALSGSVNPFTAGGRTPLTVIVEPRLDANSVTAWYLATDDAQVPVLYHGILDGQEGPLVTQMEGFDVDGMKFRCRIDLAFKAADWRAIYKNVGA